MSSLSLFNEASFVILVMPGFESEEGTTILHAGSHESLHTDDDAAETHTFSLSLSLSLESLTRRSL